MSLKKIKDWWRNNQEKNSDKYIEREEFKKELNEYSKDIYTIFESPIFDFQEKDLEKAILVQNLHAQRNLNKATDSLKTATWILALATIVFAWVSIIDSQNSNYFIQVLKSIAGLLGTIFIILITGVVIWEIIKFIFNKLKKG